MLYNLLEDLQVKEAKINFGYGDCKIDYVTYYYADFIVDSGANFLYRVFFGDIMNITIDLENIKVFLAIAKPPEVITLNE